LIELTATKIHPNRASSVEIFVRDVAGNEVRCDPVLTTLRNRVQRHWVTDQEDVVSIQNGRPGLRRVVVTVNGRQFVMRNLRPGERRKLRIGSALRPGKRNLVTLRGSGARRGGASMMIAG
jgi:hypothetical protein